MNALEALFSLLADIAPNGEIPDSSEDIKQIEKLANDALSIYPNHAGVLKIRISALIQLSRTDEPTIQLLKRYAALRPDEHWGYVNLGVLYWKQGKYELSLTHLYNAIELNPGDKDVVVNLATVLVDACQPQRALRELLGHARRFGLSRRIIIKLSSIFEQLGYYDDAIKFYNIAIALYPDQANLRFLKSFSLLKKGDYTLGWQEYEWRYLTTSFKYPIPVDDNFNEWSGECLQGKTLLVTREQGYGDHIMMARYIPLLATKGVQVIIQCRTELKRLFNTLGSEGGSIHVSTRSVKNLSMEYDYHIPIMSLPRVVGTTTSNIPDKFPYLQVDSTHKNPWKERLAATKTDKSISVGIAWAASKNGDFQRSCPLEQFSMLANLPGVNLYSLQKERSEFLDQTEAVSFPLLDFMSETGDFYDTAQIMQCLDLVISVDTSIAHLAGAMDIPVWVLLKTNCCWRYQNGTPNCLWYPNMQLYRQATPGDWGGVMKRVRSELLLFSTNRK